MSLLTIPFVCVIPETPTAEYWNYRHLRLAKGDVDAKAVKGNKKKTANVPFNYVSDLQKDLIELGYLKTGKDGGEYGDMTVRAVTRFQRHARRKFRWDGTTKTAVTGWLGNVTGICDQSTAKEVRVWIDKKYRLPFNLFKLVTIDGGKKLREDAEKVWSQAVKDAATKGAALVPTVTDKKLVYGDAWRSTQNGFVHTGGNSKRSLHYTGRAVDVSQLLANPGKKQRWWLAKEEVVEQVDGKPKTKVYWRAYCKTDLQDGSQGTKIAKDTTKFYQFGANTEAFIPEGYYLDVTAFLKERKFERIAAHDDYKTKEKGREWWHFHYIEDLQETFLDELELIGVTEDKLVAAGWTQAELDAKPA